MKNAEIRNWQKVNAIIQFQNPLTNILSDSEDDFQPGEEIPGYDCHFLAFLVPKEKYEDKIDIYPILTDDPDYPVVEIAGGRLYPVEIDSILF